MGEELKELKKGELKDLKLELIAFEGKLQLSKLFNKKILEEFQKTRGEELMIPLILFSYDKEFILVTYSNKEDYKNGKAVIMSDKSENVKEFYDTLSKILISFQE